MNEKSNWWQKKYKDLKKKKDSWLFSASFFIVSGIVFFRALLAVLCISK
ncbi:hypothetical protein ACSFB8_06390 [Enterococcus faecalis]